MDIDHRLELLVAQAGEALGLRAADEPVDVIELHEGRYKVPHRTRLWVGPQDRGLGTGVGQNGFCNRPTFRCVRVKQNSGHVAADDGGQLPAEVCSVHESEVKALTTERRVNVRRITGKQHSTAAVHIGKSRVVRPATPVIERVHTNVRAADAA